MEYKEKPLSPDSKIKERIAYYWSLRSHEFQDQRELERKSREGEIYMRYIEAALPKRQGLTILDAGCGTGMFALMLAEAGHHAVGIDLTEHMILHAKMLAAEENSTASFYCMDAEEPEFDDNTFDVIVSRNLTWTLPHPERAYREWHRVLKSGGILLNFDADYGHESFDDPDEKLPENHTHKLLPSVMLQECENIKQELDISRMRRPDWDLRELAAAGFADISVDTEISKQIYTEHNSLYNPTPMFMIRAVKK